jgi:predicted transcriptional regulator
MTFPKEKAAEVLDWLECEVAGESWPIGDEERAAVERGLADVRTGRLVLLEEVEEELGLR